MKTKAAVLVRTSEPLQVLTLDVPELKPGQVLVRVVYSGLCGTQMMEIRGKKGPDLFLPHLLGHEGAGVVVQVSSGVDKVKPGDHVVLTWIKGAGADVSSSHYADSERKINSGAISTLATLVVVSENRLVKIPEDMPLREAALLGCAVPTGAGMIMNTCRVSKGQSIAIFGVGGIGLGALAAAAAMGADPIIAIDIFDRKLDHARALGASHVINAKANDMEEAIRKIIPGGADFAIEAAGQKATMETAFRTTKSKGGLCVLAGNLPKGQTIEIDPFQLIAGKRLVGTWGGETRPDIDILKYVEMFKGNALRLDRFPTQVFPLESINEAFAQLEAGQVGRILIDLGN